MFEESLVENTFFEEINDVEKAFVKINQAYNEYIIAKTLSHPNIVQYKYFLHTFNKKTGCYQAHTILEMLEGGDMNEFIKRNLHLRSNVQFQDQILNKTK